MIKCPYREFTPCILEECPACVYETEKEMVLSGHAPMRMSTKEAIKRGYMSEVEKKTYKFKACKLIEKGVPLSDTKKEVKEVKEVKNINIRQSIF